VDGSDQYENEVHLDINGELDLHTFSPKDLKTLIPDYIDECLAREIKEIRIIHGKGKGNLRRSVHALLARNENVRSYRLGDSGSGSWGATLVTLR
jgi:dsDNA-specific endonuclease/ATPase MutS2